MDYPGESSLIIGALKIKEPFLTGLRVSRDVTHRRNVVDPEDGKSESREAIKGKEMNFP